MSLRQFAAGAVSALLATGMTAAGSTGAAATEGGRQGVAAYSAFPPGALPGNISSVGFQALRISEFGDYVGLATTGELASMRVALSSNACEDRPPPDGRCQTTPGATFQVPFTARIYEVNEATDPVSVGALITSATITFDIPFRPTSDCPDGSDQWFSAADNQCYTGLLHVIEFPASAFSSTGPLPQRIIWTVAFNTQDSGYQPIGVPGPYDALNVGASSFGSDLAAFAGTDEEPNAAFLYSSRDSTYCDGGLAGVDVLRDDLPPPDDPTRVCWLGFRPVGEINVVQRVPTVGLTATPLNARPDEPVTLTATVTCNAGTPTGTVTYLDNGTTLGTATLTGDPATAQLTTTLTPGTHTIRARYNGNTDCPTATSDPVTVTVRPVLPVTGAGLPPILTAGILLVLTGAGLLVTVRRRRLTHHT